MKIIQVSDTHFAPPGERIHGLDPRARLDTCIAEINALHADAAFCILTGDLCDAGKRAAYENLRDCLSHLVLPYHLLIGNHDTRETFAEVFPETPRDADGFVQSVLDTEAGRMLLLDTVEPGIHAGAYCATRARWLADALDAAGDRPVYIFMHHPPFEIGIPCLDRIRLRNATYFADAVAGRGTIRHIFFGHVHRPVSGSWRGIPFSALRSTNHQVPLEFLTDIPADDTRIPVPKSDEPPTYAVILIDPDKTVVHLHDFLPATYRRLG